MKNKAVSIFLTVFVFSVFFTGCNMFGKDDENNPTSSTTTGGGTTTTGTASTSDQSDVEEALANDDLFTQEMSDMLDEDESMMELSSKDDGFKLSPLSLIDTTLPRAEYHQRWRRQRTGLSNISKTLEFGKSGDTSYCNITVARNITGLFWVDTTRDGIKNPGHKPFADTITHKWYFEKYPGRGWHLAKISPREIKLTDTSKQKVFIDKIQVVSNGQTVIEITSPGQMILRDSLPLFTSGQEVKVMATVRNTSPSYYPETFVFLHHFSAFGIHKRLKMVDDGTNGDDIANDGIWTGTWRVWGNLRHYAVIDVLDSKCLQNQTDDDYNSNAWGLPYRVIP
ncbi:MAG: choice-of-anchor X domain-containing protein [bacterium]